MKNPKLELPKSAVLMVSPRDYRMSTLVGNVVNFKAGVPVKVIPNSYEQAIGIGAKLCEGEDLSEETEQKSPNASIEEAAKMEAEANADALNKALTIVLTRNDPVDFKADGSPKVQKVVAELAPEIPRPTATVIYAAYEVLQENLDLAED